MTSSVSLQRILRPTTKGGNQVKLFAICLGICIAGITQLPALAGSNEAQRFYSHAAAGALISKAPCFNVNPPSIDLALDMDALRASGTGGNLKLFADDFGDEWKLRLQTYNDDRKQWEDATGVGVLYTQKCR